MYVCVYENTHTHVYRLADPGAKTIYFRSGYHLVTDDVIMLMNDVAPFSFARSDGDSLVS